MRRQNGSALIVTVMLLLLLGVIGLSALDTVMRDQQVAGFQNRSTAAFYAAEAGVAEAKSLVRGAMFVTGNPTGMATYASPATIGDTALYPDGMPTYYGDPDVAAPIERLPQSLRQPGVGGSNMAMGTGEALDTLALFRLRVVGRTADGATSKVEAVVHSPMFRSR